MNGLMLGQRDDNEPEAAGGKDNRTEAARQEKWDDVLPWVR